MAPLRFALHGLQMASAYVGQMAPSGRIALAALFQAADELRRIERFAYRLHRLTATGRIEEDGRDAWQRGSDWQPLREAVERLLCTWDWAEAFVGLNLCLKPALDEALALAFAAPSRRAEDPALAALSENLHRDALWQRDWSAALTRLALGAAPENRAVLARFAGAAWPPVERAVRAWLAAAGMADEIGGAVGEAHAALLAAAGLGTEGPR